MVRAFSSASLLLLAYALLPLAGASDKQIVIRITIAAIIIPVVLALQIRSISRSEYPQLRAAESLIVAVTLMVVVFASVYLSMSRRDLEAFSEPLERINSLYFTVTTLTTVGYGDIVPRNDSARMAAVIQMIFNLAFLGLAARLLTSTAQRRLDANRDER